jgi:hypothetical protein
MLRLINQSLTVIMVIVASVILIISGVVVATDGNVDVLNLSSRGSITPTPISIGPTPMPSVNGQLVAPPVRGVAPLNSVLAKRPLFQNVPLPQEISYQREVVGTNLVLSMLLVLALGVIGAMLNQVKRNHEATFAGWVEQLQLGWLVRIINGGSKFVVRRGCLSLPIIVLMFALYGIIFAFLEPGTNIFGPDGIQLALVMAVSVGLVSLGGEIAQGIVSTFWKRTSRYGLYPANLLLALVTTGLSRLLGLTPGILFGIPGGTDVELHDSEKERRRVREVVLVFTTLATIIVIGASAWVGTGALANAGTTVVTQQTLEFFGPLLRLAQTLGLAIFAIAIQTAFLELWPVGATLGSRLFKWNVVMWAIVFVPVVFIFAHTMLNPHGDVLAAFQSANLRVLTAVVGVLLLLTFGLWAYFAVTDRGRVAATNPAYDPAQAQTLQGLKVPRSVDPMTLTQPSGSSLAQASVPTREIPIAQQGETVPHDTQPFKAVTITEPPVTPHDTKPRSAEMLPNKVTSKKPIKQSRYPDPTDPYAGLFPPASPEDEDFLESELSGEYTPSRGLPAVPNTDNEPTADIEQVEVAQDSPTDGDDAEHPTPPPPDSLPL